MKSFKVEKRPIQNLPSSKWLNTYMNNVYILLFHGVDLKEGKRFIIENICQERHPCEGGTGVNLSYAEDVLKDIHLTHIFVAFVASEASDDLIGKDMIPIGFAMCITSEKHGMRFELSLTCSNKTNLRLNIASMIIVEMLKYFKGWNQGIRLYAIDWQLVFYYYSFDFVLRPLNQTKSCPIDVKYLKKWHTQMTALKKEYEGIKKKYLSEEEQKKALFDWSVNLQDGLYNKLIVGYKERNFYYSIPAIKEDEEDQNYGFFMIFCPQTEISKMENALKEKLSQKQSEEAWDTFWKTYEFKIDLNKKDQILKDVFK
jgi:hypothetical protein